jgi:aconitate hydratase
MFHAVGHPEAAYTDVLELDLATVEPSLAGPSRPQDRVALRDVKRAFQEALPKLKGAAKPKPAAALPVVAAGPTPAASAFEEKPVLPEPDVKPGDLRDGSVVIAAITSCTNTSNPSVMIAAGLLARKAVACGLRTGPWVKPPASCTRHPCVGHVETLLRAGR